MNSRLVLQRYVICCKIGFPLECYKLLDEEGNRTLSLPLFAGLGKSLFMGGEKYPCMGRFSYPLVGSICYPRVGFAGYLRVDTKDNPRVGS